MVVRKSTAAEAKKAAAAQPVEPAEKAESSDKARNAAYALATRRLREQHQSEFDEILTEEYAKVGVKPRVRRTAEQIEQEKQDRIDAAEQRKKDKAREKAENLIAQAQKLLEDAGVDPGEQADGSTPAEGVASVEGQGPEEPDAATDPFE